MKRTAILVALCFSLIAFFNYRVVGQTTVKKVVLQAFWWDYWNSNYEGSWANYLTELAPRLKQMGIDAVWIPPIPKGNNGEGSVGYDVFDHYDLGDKYQKAHLNTRIGTKDELLRMIAVMHANGIEVIQDVVLNHTIGAGDLNGSLGEDPNAPDDKFKNFRYASFATPAVYGTNDNYLSRSGRWPKNHQNFHPNTDHNCNSGDICQQLFGPDICYFSNAIGQSSNATYNPVQTTNYMRNEARNWVMWLKKQTGVDGFRWDATKHFPTWVQQDLSFNLKYVLPTWARGNEAMFNVGEYVDFSASGLDNYVNAVTTANGGSDFLMGAFDFSLRAGIKSMIDGNGFYNMANLPGTQQNQRVAYYATPNLYVHRTVPFVNNHDTFRPQLDANGNYIGWNTGSELAPHIDPFNDRLPLAYALIFAVDGAPQIFFEDLFNIGGSGMRYTHDPKSATELPTREPLVRIIKLHQQLNFKDGAYKVRSAEMPQPNGPQGADFPPGNSPVDLLIIERSAKAIIALNDNGAASQGAWVDTDFPPGTILVDHSGYVSGTSQVFNDQRAFISAPPVDPANGTYGFAIWGPQGTLPTYTPSRNTETTQEWEMSNDLGDSHCQSLQQGGAIPDNSTDWRIAGKIYAAAGEQVTYILTADATKDLTIECLDLANNVLSTTNGLGNITGSFTPTQTGWITIRLRNTSASQLGQSCFVRVSYTAPAIVLDVESDPPYAVSSVWTGASSTDWFDCANWQNGRIPQALSEVTIPGTATNFPVISGNVEVKGISIEPNATLLLEATGTLNATDLLIKADVSGYGQLKVLGTLNLENAMRHQQYIGANGWHNVGASVSNPATVGNFGTIGANAPGGNANTINLYRWDATLAEWVSITDQNTALMNGAGYNVFVGKYGVMPGPGIMELEGSPITSVTPGLGYATATGNVSGNPDGWNLICNPLAATLDFSTLTLTNVNNAFYIWDAQAEAYKSWSVGGITDPYIAPLQGFWVQANSATSPTIGTIDYTKSVLSEAPAFLKTFNHLVLEARQEYDTLHKDRLVFNFNPNATAGFDVATDAYKLWNNSETPNLYSVNSDGGMAINALSLDEAEPATYLPVAFNAKASGTYVLEMLPEYFTTNRFVYLEDLTTNRVHNIKDKGYVFDYKGETDRYFNIIVSKTELTLSSVNTIAYADDGQIVLLNHGAAPGEYSLYDISGKRIAHGRLSQGESRINAPVSPGVYLITIQSSRGTETIKVVF